MKGEARKARSRKPVAKEAKSKSNAGRKSESGKKTGVKTQAAAGVRRRSKATAGSKSSRRTAVRSAGRGRSAKAAAKAPVKTPVTPSLERVREEARVLDQSVVTRVEAEPQYGLPEKYGQDRIVAMTRDPYWVCTYWEITEETLVRALQGLGKEQSNARRILRVYVVDDRKNRPERILFDVTLTPEARNWYINVGGPGRAYRVDIGLLTESGKFVCLASSNIVSTPRDRMSDVLDERWMSLPSEYEEMYVLSGGLTKGVSSPELHERLARELEVRLASPLFSPGIREVPGEKELEKPFWFTLDADLVVYGATVPGSRLVVNGAEWPLREDGTFSFRCHLPDGEKETGVSASSSDGKKREHAKLQVSRVTHRGTVDK